MTPARRVAVAVSAGATNALLDAAARAAMPLLAGGRTASEVMRLPDAGLEVMECFPAAPAGGKPALRAPSGPLPEATFCPTGSIGAASASDCSTGKAGGF